MRLGRAFKITVIIASAGCAFGAGDESPPTDWPVFEQTLRDQVVEWIRGDRIRRDDGNIYTVDVAQLMTYAALRGDEELYLELLPVVLQAQVEHQSEAYVRGFVTWRTGGDPDASGTTEALRVVEALWRGAAAFNRSADRNAALEILDGYRRHEYVDQGIWFIRNYYNLRTRAFATNSYLVDYDPDLTAELAGQVEEFAELARQVKALVRDAATPSGLLHELVQPELLTAMPTLKTGTFSPNNSAQVSNSCTVLERSVRTLPDLAKGLLEFAEGQERLALIYDVASGIPKHAALAGGETFSCFVRLAYRLGESAERFERNLDGYTHDFLARQPQPRAYMASEFLLTAYYRSPS